LQRNFGVYLGVIDVHVEGRAREPLSLARALFARFTEKHRRVVMKVRLVASLIVALLIARCAPGQSVPGDARQSGTAVEDITKSSDASRQKLLRGVVVAEAAVQRAEAAHVSNVVLSKAYLQLGLWCQNAALWDRAEAALEHAIALLRHPPDAPADLSAAISQLASLHLMLGRIHESEKEQQEALKIRLGIGDPLLIARSQDDLAILFLAKLKYDKARDLARLAEAEFTRNERADVLDRVTSRVTLSEALCNLNACPSAIPMLMSALEEAKASLPSYEFPIGLSDFLLGYAYWKSGKMTEAAPYLAQGTTEISKQLGWGHPAYLRALKCYAEFLHADRQQDAADVVERRIRQMEAVVDVHSLKTAQGMFQGLH
jgi:tetratricopeptide (TPR) repeat protein